MSESEDVWPVFISMADAMLASSAQGIPESINARVLWSIRLVPRRTALSGQAYQRSEQKAQLNPTSWV